MSLNPQTRIPTIQEQKARLFLNQVTPVASL